MKLPFYRLLSPDDVPPVDPPIDEEIVTFKKSDYEKEKSRIFSGGMKQEKERYSKQEQSYLEQLAEIHSDVTGKPLGEALKIVVEEYKKKGGSDDDEKKLLKEKIAGLTGELTKRDGLVQSAKQEANDYIINNELLGVVSSKVFDPSDAIQLFRNNYKVERVANGEIRIYDKSGEIIKNADFEPASLKQVMEEFLAKKPHLVKSENRGGTGDKARDGMEKTTDASIKNILQKRESDRTPEEKTKLHAAWKEGKVSLKDALQQ